MKKIISLFALLCAYFSFFIWQLNLRNLVCAQFCKGNISVFNHVTGFGKTSSLGPKTEVSD